MPRGDPLLLLRSFQQLCLPEGFVVSESWQPDIKVENFEHGGHSIRGLRVGRHVGIGRELLKFPANTRVTEQDVQDDRFQGCDSTNPDTKVACSYAKYGLWVAEKKLEVMGSHDDASQSFLGSWWSWWQHRLVKSGDAKKDYWASFIYSLPSREDFKELGLPLTAPWSEVRNLRGLPKFDDVPDWTAGLKYALKQSLDHYNSHRGEHAEISQDDALWGLQVAFTRSFDCNGQMTLAPLGDLMNHSSHGNVVYYCDKDMLKFVSRKTLNAGDELLASYHGPQDSVTMLSQYGILDDSEKDSWSEKECDALREAHLDDLTSPYMRNVAKLVDVNCPAPVGPAELRASARARLQEANVFGGMQDGTRSVVLAALQRTNTLHHSQRTCWAAFL
eukprot:TRINITY_DN107442_c0_g1_i1.p1 TRINITY_DN107442_c0_g1~~TRINITY_DN107442_c0_g1_i1.p1  ORF type:complete len:389 (+),score=54.49 TRINITY_DN107442_c0_g1_i1:66-1232(+)